MKFVLAAVLFIAMSWAVSGHHMGNKEACDGNKEAGDRADDLHRKFNKTIEDCPNIEVIYSNTELFLMGKFRECQDRKSNPSRRDGDDGQVSDAPSDTEETTECQTGDKLGRKTLEILDGCDTVKPCEMKELLGKAIRHIEGLCQTKVFVCN